MADEIGAWERKAKICLVDATKDNEIFTNVLEKLTTENSANKTVFNRCVKQIEDAKVNLDNKSENFFICMFVWGYESQLYLPFTSPSFKSDDVDLLHEIIKKFIDISIQCCSNGFEVVTFNDDNKLLAFALQATCENEMMQINLKA